MKHVYVSAICEKLRIFDFFCRGANLRSGEKIKLILFNLPPVRKVGGKMWLRERYLCPPGAFSKPFVCFHVIFFMSD